MQGTPKGPEGESGWVEDWMHFLRNEGAAEGSQVSTAGFQNGAHSENGLYSEGKRVSLDTAKVKV